MRIREGVKVRKARGTTPAGSEGTVHDVLADGRLRVYWPGSSRTVTEWPDHLTWAGSGVAEVVGTLIVRFEGTRAYLLEVGEPADLVPCVLEAAEHWRDAGLDPSSATWSILDGCRLSLASMLAEIPSSEAAT